MRAKLIEIVPEVEDAFGFAIAEEDTVALVTLGDLYDCVLAQRFCGKKDVCLNSIAFYKTRQALMSVLQIPRNKVQPSTELTAIIQKRWRRTWQKIKKISGLRLPILRRPRWVVTTATLTAIALGIWMAFLLKLKPFRGGTLVAILSTGLFGHFLYYLTKFLAYCLPPDIATVGQLSKAILARNYRPIVAEFNESPTDAEIWGILRGIVGKQWGVDPNQLTKKTELAGDLGTRIPPMPPLFLPVGTNMPTPSV